MDNKSCMEIYVAKISDTMEEFEKRSLSHNQLAQLMPQFRIEKARACLSVAERERSLLAGMLLGCCMKKRGVSLEETPCFDKYGKLYFPHIDRFYVNLSHGGNYAVCAMDTAPVGVDIETVRQYKKNVAERICTSVEMQSLLILKKEEEKNRVFTKLWTRKESMAKLSGEGIGLLLRAGKPSEEFVKDCVYTKTYTPVQDTFLSVSSFQNAFPEDIMLLSPESLLQLR